MTNDSGSVADRRRELERRLAELSPAKRALFDRDTAPTTAPAPAPDDRSGPRPRAAGAPVPMSFAQELLWLLDRAQPGMHGYNVPRTVRLRGTLDHAALQRALDAVVARHEVLRTTFDLVDGEPRQIVGAPTAVSIARMDFSDGPAASRDEAASRVLAELARRPFDLATDLQLRATLLRLAADDHVLLLESHHVASDAWSRNILMREISELYRAFRDGVPVALAPLEVQYGDFAIWQRESLTGKRLDALRDYWRAELADAPTTLDLPTDRPHPRVPGFDGATRSRMFPVALLERLRELSRAQGATLFMTLLGAFDVLLARYAGQDDIVVGSPIAGRQLAEVEGVIGYFANTLVLRTRLDGDPTFIELLARVRETALGAYDHQDIPYEKLVLDLQSDRAAGRTSLFQVMFTVQDSELRSLQLDGVDAEAYGAARGATKFDLSLFMQERTGGLRAMLEYRTDLFDASTIDRMLRHLEVLLEGIAREPDAPISRLSMLDATEVRSVIVDVNETDVRFAAPETLPEMIAAQAARTPDACALEWERDDGTIARLSFGALWSRARALANAVRATNGANVGVAICAPRSPELVIAMLAVLEAGGFYVPLDPEYPDDRLAFMLRDSGARTLLVTDGARAPLLATAADLGLAVVQIGAHDGDASRAAKSEGTSTSTATRSDLAYVIYTSGSTGQPKGVMISHRAVVNYLSWMQQRYPLDATDAVLQKAPASFDASIWEFFLPLTTGARLVLARAGGAQDPEYLLDSIARHALTVMQLVPAQLRMVLETPDAAPRLAVLRQLFLGGEALPLDLAAAFRQQWPDLAVANLYGPTEATVYATSWDLPLGAWHEPAVPIGRPIANTKIYLLDPHGSPVPFGVGGELCIGGAGVASGYLNRATLTAERFVPDPFDGGAGARMYRTGDRARRRADGTLEYLGRMDTQVKLRGFRVELGEIESALAHQPEVRSAVVVVSDDRPGDQRLIAYCVPETLGAGDATLAATVRKRLTASLPDFMVPTAFVWLDAWPLNANGKLDRRALPAPADADAPAAQKYVGPRDDVEAAIAEIWGELLDRRVGVDDDVFAIGGHSLTALRALSRIFERLGVRLALRVVFESPTVAELAQHVRAARSGASQAAAYTPIARQPDSYAPLSHGQELLWLMQHTTPDLAAYNVADQWRIGGTLDRVALASALDALVERHEALRTTFAVRDGVPVQIIGAARSVPLEVSDLRALPPAERGAAIERAAREFADQPFDLESDVLLRARLVQCGDAEHVLVLVTHHVVSDGWSRGILLRELGALYASARAGTPVALAPLPVRYVDFASWQRARLDSAEASDEMRYWARKLGGATLAVDIPTDHPRAHGVSFEGTKRTVLYPRHLLDALRGLATANGTTLFSVLLAAFEVLLYRYSGQDDLVLGTVVAGRTREELEGVVGYFANTVALRTSLAGDPTFTDMIGRVRETYLDAIEHGDVPFEAIARELQRSGASAAESFCQVMFVLQNVAAEELSLGDASVRASGMKATTSKLDLSVSMGEQENGLRVAIEYRTDLYEHTTVERMFEHLGVLLAGIAKTPGAPIAELPLISSAESDTLLAWGSGVSARLQRDTPEPPRLVPAPVSRPCSDLESIAAVAARTPDALAVNEDWGSQRSLTYAALVAAVERAAARLRALGVERGDLVAVYAERSLETIVTLLAIQSAGAAYVPLDPANPAERIAFVLRDTAAQLVIAQRDMFDPLRAAIAELPAATHPRLVSIEEVGGDSSPLPLGPYRAIAEMAAADDVAYVLYTSGSTGKPKGVLIEHRNLVHHSAWIQANLQLASGEGMLHVTTLTFDTSVSEVFDTLAAGARLVLATPGGQHDPAYIADALIRQRIVSYETVPSVLALVLDEFARGHRSASASSLRHVSVGGEVLPPELAARFYEILPNSVLHNGYGPTETTIDATWWVVRRSDVAQLLRDATVPIGGPIGEARAYVVDARGALVPVGVPGELWIGGAGVGRGYLNRPELTAERFTRDPFASEPGARVYRTGDRVRWLADGTIEFLGRTDHQVKIGGVRVELSEIEAVLASFPGVRQVAVVLRGHGAGAQLAAYVAGGESVAVRALRAHARAKLPGYMVPAQVVVLPELPTMASGKIDRLRLPVLDGADESDTEWIAPRTSTEEACARIWTEVLSRARIGRAHSFFELGGNSLAAMRIAARIHDLLGVRLPLNTIFERSTLAEFAAAVDAARGSDGVGAVVSAIPRASRAAARRPAPSGDVV